MIIVKYVQANKGTSIDIYTLVNIKIYWKCVKYFIYSINILHIYLPSIDQSIPNQSYIYKTSAWRLPNKDYVSASLYNLNQ